jgi:hypothetical protein
VRHLVALGVRIRLKKGKVMARQLAGLRTCQMKIYEAYHLGATVFGGDKAKHSYQIRLGILSLTLLKLKRVATKAAMTSKETPILIEVETFVILICLFLFLFYRRWR